jgi:uncharacterized protein YndB with AHSA1/START domain
VSNTTTSLPTTLVMKHTFNAPIERVFDAWTTPQIMREFMCPGEITTQAEVDARVDGAYRIVMHKPDGEELIAYGIYRELTRPTRIVCTWQWEEDDPALAKETLLTLEFAPRGTQTELTLTHENFRDAQQRDGHAAGWGEIMTKLERVVS